MPPVLSKKRKSIESPMSNEEQNAVGTAMGQKVPTKTGSPSASQGSPYKKRKTGITLAQKQALIENLQLEVTERARKLRAGYRQQAQGVRTMIELRVHRIPMSLRHYTMGDLLERCSKMSREQSNTSSLHSSRGPPVPEKDNYTTSGRFPIQKSAHLLSMPMGSPARPIKRSSRDISGGDKENEVSHVVESPKKARLGPAAEIARNPGQVLSPTSSNSRIAPRGAAAAPPPSSSTANLSPIKSGIARPVSPFKTANIISNMVEKARSTTTRAPAPTTTTTSAPTPAATRRARANTTSTITTTTSSSSSERSGNAARATRTRGTGATAAQQPPRLATRTARRVSGISESSEGSTSTVVRKRPGTAMSTKSAPGGTSSSSTATSTKRNVISTIKKGVAASTSKKGAGAGKAAAAATTAASTTGTGRVLRKRG